MNSIDHRLQVLESAFLRSHWINRILCVVILAMACMGSDPINSLESPPAQQSGVAGPTSSTDQSPPLDESPQSIAANEFLLRDQAGRVRAKLVANEVGPAFVMFDEENRKRIEMSVVHGESSLSIFDKNELALVNLSLEHDRAGSLKIQDSNGRSTTTASGFCVNDAADGQRLIFALINGNFPMLGLSQSGQNSPPNIELNASEGSRSLKFHNEDGSQLLSLFAESGSLTSLNLTHPDHERSLQVTLAGENMAGPEISFLAPYSEGIQLGGILPYLQLGLDENSQPFIRTHNSNAPESPAIKEE